MILSSDGRNKAGREWHMTHHNVLETTLKIKTVKSKELLPNKSWH